MVENIFGKEDNMKILIMLFCLIFAGCITNSEDEDYGEITYTYKIDSTSREK